MTPPAPGSRDWFTTKVRALGLALQRLPLTRQLDALNMHRGTAGQVVDTNRATAENDHRK